nr:HAD-IG family 5'-nucleotidase [bacterium]
SIAAIGFDMDHTLALYNHRVFEQLCFEMAIDLMVSAKGYPEVIRETSYDRSAIVRGLIIDKRLGNIVKMDASGYVARVRHGGELLTREDRRKAYKRGRIRLTSQRYRVVDTLFDLPEGSLYSALVALKDGSPGLIKTSYKVLFEDIRDAIDTIHRDGSLKRQIMSELPRFFVKDAQLEATLTKFREAGKKLFLLTNSEPDYTGAVMSYILSNGGASWTDLFDLIICSSRKPGFFLPQGKGRAVPPSSVPGLDHAPGQCYTGGDAFFLESKLGVIGDSILYFGDHTFGDILRSKRSAGWRTAMIVPEVEEEILAAQPVLDLIRELEAVEATLEDLTLERDHMLSVPDHDTDAVRDLQDHIGSWLGRRAHLQKRIATVYSPVWGSIFREGRASSRFGEQIKDVACIYTSRVSNLNHYPAQKFFVSARERMPHE